MCLVVLVEFIKEREFRNGHLQYLHGKKPPEFLLYQPNENQNDKFHKNAHLL